MLPCRGATAHETVSDGSPVWDAPPAIRREAIAWFELPSTSEEEIMKALAALLCVVAFTWSPVRAGAQQISPAKQAEIDTLMQVTGVINLAQQMSAFFAEQAVNTIKATRPDIPDRALVIAREVVTEVVAQNVGGLKPLLAEVYDRHLTLEDLRGLTAFYRSPLGQKTISVMPVVMQECGLAGRQWGEALGPQIDQLMRERLKKEKIDL